MIYGLLRITNAADPFIVLDDVFFNKKIKIFDTANCYGKSETIFGDWMTSRKIDRNEVYIICKGGHHSCDGPTIKHRIDLFHILYDIKESFARLKIKHADTFMFHRDDESISPEKIFEICDYLLESKLCNKIGVSNWKTSRIEEVNNIAESRNGNPIIEESQIFLNYIKLEGAPYPNIHMIDHKDYNWYLKHPEHKVQIYSVACFLGELDNNPIHQNKIFKKILEHFCVITNESKQTILYVLLSKSRGLNVSCIQGSKSPHHILSQTKIDEIFSRIETQNPKLLEFIPCFLSGNPNSTKIDDDMVSFLTNGFVGPLPLQDIKLENIDSIVDWLLSKNFRDYQQMKHHHEYKADIRELCMNKTINEMVTKYIGYECICYNTEFFTRQNNEDFLYTANWHIDPYLNFDRNYPHFTIQIGLTDNDENNCLNAIIGSHLFDYQNTVKRINKNDIFAPLVSIDDKSIDEKLVCRLLNKKGFVYLISNYVTHGKGIKKQHDANTRVALTMRIISKKSNINTLNSSHISKDIFTLGTSNINFSTVCSNTVWKIVQNQYADIFADDKTTYIIANTTYTWENSYIRFLDDFRMDAFGEGKYEFLDNKNVIANFGGRIHHLIFNHDFTAFLSTRFDDSHVVVGKRI
jgi:predicted oxidoreductase